MGLGVQEIGDGGAVTYSNIAYSALRGAKAATFNGTTSGLTITPNAKYEKGTITTICWFAITTAQTQYLWAYLPQGAHSNGAGLCFVITAANLFTFQGGDRSGSWKYIQDTAGRCVGRLYCVVCTINSTVMKMYVDGVLSKTGAGFSISYTDLTGTPPNPNNKSFRVGHSGSIPDYFFAGKMYEFSWLDRVMDARAVHLYYRRSVRKFASMHSLFTDAAAAAGGGGSAVPVFQSNYSRKRRAA